MKAYCFCPESRELFSMSNYLPSSPHASDVPPWPVRRFTVEEYHRLGELGVLSPDDNVELLEGWIVEKMNPRPAHGFVVGLLTQSLFANLPKGWIGRCQLPITTLTSEPEPDLAFVRGAHSDYRANHPSGKEVALIIEVADTSLERDRSKATIYAIAGVKEYWIVNLPERQLEQFRDSDGKAFRKCNILKASESASTQIDSHSICLDLDVILL
jgi:Uma2 family endonuclease